MIEGQKKLEQIFKQITSVKDQHFQHTIHKVEYKKSK